MTREPTRSARKLVVIAMVMAASAVPASRVNAVPQALTGVGHVTFVSGCPGGFKIPIAGESHADGTWTFAIAGAHLGCVITWGNPIAFSGPWDPVNPSCDAQTGAGCPQSLDPTRPGFLALGRVPNTLSMAVTDLRLCVKGNCFEGWALVERTGPAQKPAAAAAGLGEVTPPEGCNPGALKMPIEAHNDGGPVWLVVRPASLAVECGAIVYGLPNVFVGNWNPDIGGCIASMTHPSTRICLGALPATPTPRTIPLDLCFSPGPSDCWRGSATMVRPL